MNPEDAVKAFKSLGARLLCAMHREHTVDGTAVASMSSRRRSEAQTRGGSAQKMR
jgi:hypothetical protein